MLDALAAIAPTTAVRGNNDRGAWAESLRESELVEIGGIVVYAIHDIADIDLDPAAAGVRVVVTGHSHKPRGEERDGVLYVNPGSAGPRRFRLPISIAELVVDGGEVSCASPNWQTRACSLTRSACRRGRLRTGWSSAAASDELDLDGPRPHRGRRRRLAPDDAHDGEGDRGEGDRDQQGDDLGATAGACPLDIAGRGPPARLLVARRRPAGAPARLPHPIPIP